MSKLNLESMFGDAEFDMDCPNCDKNFKFKYKKIAKSGNKIRCPHCREDITVEHDAKTKKELAEADKALKDFDKTLKEFGK